MKLKDKRIKIFRPVNAINENGFPVETMELVAGPIWAYYRHLSIKEKYAADREIEDAIVRFDINYRSGLNTDMVVEFRNQLYEITQIDDFEGYRGDITIYAKARV